MGALLMLAPLVAVPILAVVGIPQFAPGNLIDVNGGKSAAYQRENRAPAEPRIGDAARHDADDLFAPLENSVSDAEEFEDPLRGKRSRTRSRGASRHDDEFASESTPRSRNRSSGHADHEHESVELGDDLNEVDSAESFNAATDDDSVPFHQRRPRTRKSVEQASTEGDDAEFFESEVKAPSRKKPREEQFADAGEEFAPLDAKNSPASKGQRGRRSVPSDLAAPPATAAGDDVNPFEGTTASNRNRPAPQRNQRAAAPRDPQDAPVFQPEPSALDSLPNEPDVIAPPSPRAPAAGRRAKPRNNELPPEEPESTGETSSNAIAETSEPGIEELTWQSATKRLRALGVGKNKQYFTYVEDRDLFLFNCTAVHCEDANRSKPFQAEAKDPLLAVQQVLEKLESWQASAGSGRTSSRGRE